MSVLGAVRSVRRLPRPAPGGRRISSDDRLGTVEHLGELRTRLAICVASVFVMSVVAFLFRAQIIDGLNRPLGDAQPVTLGVAEPFLTSLKVSLLAGAGMAMPVLAWQLWGFFSPAVGTRRRLVTGVLAGIGTALFAGGATFGYFVALPSAVTFLTGFDAGLYDIQVRASDYYIFATAVIVSLGLVFELPLLLLGAVRIGLVSARTLRENRRIGYVALTVLAVCLPGVDPVLTALELVPLALLYELTMQLARFVEPAEDPTLTA